MEKALRICEDTPGARRLGQCSHPYPSPSSSGCIPEPPPFALAPAAGNAPVPRSGSSAYPSPGHSTPRFQSPVSEYFQGNRLSLSGLSQFGRANDCLSNLRSSSSSAPSNEPKIGDTSHHELIADAAAAITEWQDAVRPLKKSAFNNYSLADSSDLFPSDSLSQQQADRSLSLLTASSPFSDVTRESGASDTSDTPQSLINQYDGVLDAPGSESPVLKPPVIRPVLDDPFRPSKPSKRKASIFSIRSVTKSWAKRRRLSGFRRWAGNMYRSSSRRLIEAYRKLKHGRSQAHLRHPGRPRNDGSDEGLTAPSRGNSESGQGPFRFNGDSQTDSTWWEEGTRCYRAPSGMFAR